MTVIFTDLDGTLLDHNTYSFEPAVPVLARLRELRIPWVLVTSKTRAETEPIREIMGNEHPFIVENGGAVWIPRGTFSAALEGSRRVDGYDVLEWGMPYEQVVQKLAEASRISGCRVTGFHQMDAPAIAALSGLSVEQARLAKQRNYGEPFQIHDIDRTEALLGALANVGLRWTRGGRFWHAMGANDKAQAVKHLIALYEEYGKVESVGLGDNINDAGFLAVVGSPIAIRSGGTEALQALVPNIFVTEARGPEGWSDAVQRFLPA